MIAHADTVREPSFQNQIEFNQDKTLLLGPGVADDKGGVVVALYGLRLFLEKTPAPLFNIEFISSPNEEVGSTGFIEDLQTSGKTSQYILGFEPSPHTGEVITSRHGNRWYEIEIIGKEAHSGRANGEEINAAHELCEKITAIVALKKKYPNVKINIGSIETSHQNFNIVCGKILARLDIRFLSEADAVAIDKDIVSLLEKPLLFCNKGEPAITHYRICDHCPPLEKNPESESLIDVHLKNLSQIELKNSNQMHGSGASDSCHATHKQAITIDGLGPIGGHLHTTKEFVILESIETRAKAYALLLEEINLRYKKLTSSSS
jgi:glutamate carboxypeptidase